MKNKGFTLIELLAVIVVLGIIMLIAVTSISGVLEKSRRDSYVSTARAYIDGVRKKIMVESIDLPTVDNESTIIYLDKTMVEKGGITSPYGSDYLILPDATRNQTEIDTANSASATALSNVRVVCDEYETGKCRYTYWVFLSDGRNATGCYDDDLDIGRGAYSEDDLDSTDIAPLATCS